MALIEKYVKKAVEWFLEAKYPIFLSGAGISQESGIPTFRDKGGIWEKYNWEELATPMALERNPQKVWEFYQLRRKIVLQAKPNKAHEIAAILQEETKMPIITQNVDGLHQKAGAKEVIEMHGSILRVRCTSCSYKEEFLDTETPLPSCPKCKNLLRPDVVLFGEFLDPEVVAKIQNHLEKADFIFVVGTSLQVAPASMYPRYVLENGGKVVEINPKGSGLHRYYPEWILLEEKASLSLERFYALWKILVSS